MGYLTVWHLTNLVTTVVIYHPPMDVISTQSYEVTDSTNPSCAAISNKIPSGIKKWQSFEKQFILKYYNQIYYTFLELDVYCIVWMYIW